MILQITDLPSLITSQVGTEICPVHPARWLGLGITALEIHLRPSRQKSLTGPVNGGQRHITGFPYFYYKELYSWDFMHPD